MQAAVQELRTATFGTFDDGPWGVIWEAGSSVVLLTSAHGQPLKRLDDARISASTETGDWQLEADGVELQLSGNGDPARNADDNELTGLDQRCDVRGHAAIDGIDLSLDCPGVRGIWTTGGLDEFESIRRVCAWFESGDGVALLALRPRKSRAHGRDVLAASVLEAGGSRTVADPRLSTTYDRTGTPERAGLELWVEGEDDKQYSRRAAGQSVGSGSELSNEELSLRADLFRWQARGQVGVGVYLLARRR